MTIDVSPSWSINHQKRRVGFSVRIKKGRAQPIQLAFLLQFLLSELNLSELSKRREGRCIIYRVLKGTKRFVLRLKTVLPIVFPDLLDFQSN